jgi:LCP family protein required for cell wall assembly
MSRFHDPDGTGDHDGTDGLPARRGTLTRYRPSDDLGEREERGAVRTRAAGRGGQRRAGRAGASGAGSRRRSAPTAGGGRPRSPGKRRGLAAFGHRPVLSIIAIIATAILTIAALTAYVAYRNVYDSIHHIDVTNQMLGKRPPKLNGSLNVLMIGSDSRAGSHGRYGRGIVGSRSDTTMLLHISPTHDHAFVISFPRDSMVPIYHCEAEGRGHPGQAAQPGSVERLNATFSAGGPPCLWYTLEQTTHIHIDHFMEVDFAGFRKIVNDIGGVNVCLPFAIKDPASGLNLPKGPQLIHGTQALAFVRERHIGLGSDLQRIQRQQLFLASVAQKMRSSGILANPPKLYTLVHDVASSLTTDTGLSLTDMYAIANSLRNLSTKSLRFISVPVIPYPLDPGAEVQWAQPSANDLFRAIAQDDKIAKAAQSAAEADKAGPSPSPSSTVSPSQVQLRVLNGTQTAGLAASTASTLTAKGFKVTGTGNAPTSGYTTSVIEYGSASQLPQANTLAQEITGAQLKQVTGLPAGSIALVLGSSFTGFGSTPGPGPAKHKPPSPGELGNAYGGISGNANICKDSGAFAGPDNPSQFTPGASGTP